MDSKKKAYWNDFDNTFFRSPNIEENKMLEETFYKEPNNVLYQEIDNAIECGFVSKYKENENELGISSLNTSTATKTSTSNENYKRKSNNLTLYVEKKSQELFKKSNVIKVVFELSQNDSKCALVNYKIQKSKDNTKDNSKVEDLESEIFTNIKNRYIITGTKNLSMLDSILESDKDQYIIKNTESFSHELNVNGLSLINKEDSLMKILKLKNFDIMTFEEVKEIICCEIFDKELKNSLLKKDNIDITDIDDLTREILYLNFLLYKITIRENNKKKMKIKEILHEDEIRKHTNIKLKE